MNNVKRLTCPSCRINWPKYRRNKSTGELIRVNFCRHCAAALWQTLPCGHDTPISELPYNYCGECGKPTELAAVLVQA